MDRHSQLLLDVLKQEAQDTITILLKDGDVFQADRIHRAYRAFHEVLKEKSNGYVR